MKIRRAPCSPDWLEWLGSDYRTFDKVDELIAKIAPSISAHLTEAVIDWIEMGVIEIEQTGTP